MSRIRMTTRTTEASNYETIAGSITLTLSHGYWGENGFKLGLLKRRLHETVAQFHEDCLSKDNEWFWEQVHSAPPVKESA